MLSKNYLENIADDNFIHFQRRPHKTCHENINFRERTDDNVPVWWSLAPGQPEVGADHFYLSEITLCVHSGWAGMPCNLISSCFFPESPWFRDPADCGPGHQPGQQQHHDWQSNNHPGPHNLELSTNLREIFTVPGGCPPIGPSPF